MKESTEELKAIIAGKPSDELATHVDEDGDYVKSGELVDSYFNGHKWVDMNNSICTRSLSDIEEIIKLRGKISEVEYYNKVLLNRIKSSGEHDG